MTSKYGNFISHRVRDETLSSISKQQLWTELFWFGKADFSQWNRNNNVIKATKEGICKPYYNVSQTIWIWHESCCSLEKPQGQMPTHGNQQTRWTIYLSPDSPKFFTSPAMKQLAQPALPRPTVKVPCWRGNMNQRCWNNPWEDAIMKC